MIKGINHTKIIKTHPQVIHDLNELVSSYVSSTVLRKFSIASPIYPLKWIGAIRMRVLTIASGQNMSSWSINDATHSEKVHPLLSSHIKIHHHICLELFFFFLACKKCLICAYSIYLLIQTRLMYRAILCIEELYFSRKQWFECKNGLKVMFVCLPCFTIGSQYIYGRNMYIIFS